MTGTVEIGNVTVEAPAGTVTDAGTVASALADPRVITAPPLGAGPVRVIVPTDGEPPIRELGDRVSV